MLHNNINTGPDVILSSSKIIRSRQFLEKKKPAPGSTGGGRKKSTAKKPAPVKGRSGSKKDKQRMESTEPPSEMRDEDDSASSSDRTASHNTEENESGKEKGPIEQEQSASIETGADDHGEEDIPETNDQEVAENIVRRIMEEIDLQAHKAAEVYKRYSPGTPKSQLQLLVLDILAVKKGEFIDEVARLEAVREQQNITHSPRHEDVDSQNPGDKSPLADQAINKTDDRLEPLFTDNLESDQVRDSEPPVTEEKFKSLIQEFVNTAVKPWKKKIKKVVVQTIKMAETTRDDLVKANDWITKVEVNYRDDSVLYDAHLKRTVALEDTTSKLVDDLERFQGKTEQRLTKVDEDLGRSSTEAGSTLDMVTSLEEKNASLAERNDKIEADLKAVTEQVNELINAKLAVDKAVEEANAQAAKELQDALDEETRKTKEAPRLCDANLAKRARNPRRLPPLRFRQHERGKFLQ
ncbi:uncharacterized abhydrolase domain-containing protein DDB_G0269086-like [Impatiens glandulifera]|uniref:uncharacterized abhydrolase domain-containing protein DDB_G0269086-like n=1 Tax=Impatiens glandulifera TaxID=253017 RepID=UPI001FB14CDD|nr:uncharacterized abhydrolase domain-containing protein DDB_G0269086-like [Impatiens glandulifera]